MKIVTVLKNQNSKGVIQLPKLGYLLLFQMTWLSMTAVGAGIDRSYIRHRERLLEASLVSMLGFLKYAWVSKIAPDSYF